MLFRRRTRGTACAATLAVLAGSAISLIGTATASADPSPATVVVATADHYSAVIRRTDFGIPHILGASFGDLGYGYGYAFAQDNLCTLADLVLTVDGERSRYFGPDAATGDLSAGDPSNLDSDVFQRWVDDSGIVSRTFGRPAPLGLTGQARQMIDGYVAGVNRYLAVTGAADLPDPTCRAKPWVHPVSAAEIERILYADEQSGGVDNLQTQIAEAVPAVAPTGSPADVNVDPSDSGSNGLAVGRAGTPAGDGLLLANPHLPWVGVNRLYQVQLTIPGVYDMTGASVYGTPVIEVGHNQHVAWTHTDSTAQQYTLYQLHLVPGRPTSYLVDGHAEAMGRHAVSVPLADGTTTTRSVYTSRYGPILSIGWTPATAIAIRGAGVTNGRLLNEWLAMSQAESIAQLRDAQQRYQGTYNNTIATDSGGTAYYADASAVPNVTDAEIARCVDSPLGRAMLPEKILLDGSTSGCAWGDSPDAIVPGIFGPSVTPTLTRTDYVMNSNNSAWLTNPAAPITMPLVYGTAGTPLSLRTRLGLNIIDRRLAGTDGLGAPGFTVPTTEQALMNDRNLSADLAKDATVAMCRDNPSLTATDGTVVDVSAACPVLAAWDGTENTGSRGAVLWRQYWLGAAGSPNLWTVPFDPAHPATTPNTLNTADPVVRRSLADAVERMRALNLPLAEPLSAAQVTDVTGVPVAVPGCGNVEGCYNVVQVVGGGGGLRQNGMFPAVDAGASFIMVADMSPHGPSAQTVTTYSESADPDSPHHADQTALFARKQWVADRFTEHEIMTDPYLTITVLAGR